MFRPVGIIYIYPGGAASLPLSSPFLFLPGGLRPLDPPLARTGGRGTHFLVHFNCFFTMLFGGLQALGGISFFCSPNFISMHSKSCLGIRWGPSYEHICKNMYFCKG